MSVLNHLYLNQLYPRILAGESASAILHGLSPQQKGHTGEALLRILVLFGIHPTDASKGVVPCDVVPKDRRVKAIVTLAERISRLKIGRTNSGGANKIDVCWQDGDTLAVCSSKIGKNQVKGIANLEIVPMLAEFTEAGGYTMDGKRVSRDSVVAYVLVPNKEEVLAVAARSGPSNRVSKENLLPLDGEELDHMCAVLRERIAVGINTGHVSDGKDVENVLGYLMDDKKPALRTRFHQKLLGAKMRRMRHKGAKTILLGALPRSGKTYIGADMAKDYKRILVITTRPTETKAQWMGVFATHREFSGYIVVDLEEKNSEEVATRCRLGEAIVVVASAQFFKVEEREALDDVEWDIVLLDEIHAGGSTERSQAMMERYIGPNAVRIMMTATYTKPVTYYDIPVEHCCFWDLEDVRLMRSWGEPWVQERLGEKYGVEEVGKAREKMLASGETDATIRACYEEAPRLGILTTAMQADTYDTLRRLLVTEEEESVYGFSMRSLFMPTKDGQGFQNPKAVDTFLRLVSGSHKMINYLKGDMSMFARIRRLWANAGHRHDDTFMTQVWFLPSGVGQLLEPVKRALQVRMAANPVLAKYAVMTLDAGMKDIVEAVRLRVKEAREEGQEGVILLTGDVGSLGVSLPDVDVAFLLHDKESADMTYQQMMRVLTEAAREKKRCGLVVDFNLWRMLTTLNTYATSRCGQGHRSSAERIHWCISHLVDVDPDLWQCPESPLSFSQATLAEELTGQWRRSLEQSGCSLRRLARTPVDLGDDQAALDRIAKYMEDDTSGTVRKEEMKVNPDQEALPSGVERRSKEMETEEESGDEKESVSSEEETEHIKHANLNDILARLIPEIAVLSGCKTDLLEAVRAIHGNPAQREALNAFLVKMNQAEKKGKK